MTQTREMTAGRTSIVNHVTRESARRDPAVYLIRFDQYLVWTRFSTISSRGEFVDDQVGSGAAAVFCTRFCRTIDYIDSVV